MQMKTMILAAGRGERMGALTSRSPKPLLDVGGRSLIERHLESLVAAGLDDIVINLSYRGPEIRDKLGDGRRYGAVIRYSEEGDPPLETAGGIVHALPFLGRGRFLLVNADVLTDLDFGVVAATDRATLVLVPNPPHHPRGDFGLDASGRVGHAEPKLTFSGVSVLDTNMFEPCTPGRRPLKPVLDAAIEAGTLFGLRHDGLWLDVGTPERLGAARRLMTAREARRRRT
jgi:MurNAc alpha-1-phosphate uridylyltransferase